MLVYIGCLKLKQHINEKPVSVLGVKYRVRGMVLNATQQYFSHIVAVSFIRGGNQSTQRKLLKNVSHNVVLSTPRHERDSNSQLK